MSASGLPKLSSLLRPVRRIPEETDHLLRMSAAMGRGISAIIRNRITGRPPEAPRVSHLVLTWECNLRCEGCGAWRNTQRRALSGEEFTAVARNMRPLDVIKVVGGEPFSHPEISRVVGALKREAAPYLLQIVTNGTQTERIEEVVCGHGWPGMMLRISLDGLQDVHDRARGQGSFLKAMRTINRLLKLQPELGFGLGINFHLTEHSLPQAESMAEMARGLGVDLHPGVPVAPFLHHATSDDETPRVLLDDRDAALSQLERPGVGPGGRKLGRLLRTAARMAGVSSYRRMMDDGAPPFRCLELRDLAYVMPDGEVVICGLDHRGVGSLKESDFATIWASPRCRELRRQVDRCRGCRQAAVEIFSRLYGGEL